MRVRLETDAYYLILNGIQRNIYQMITSKMHYRELESITDIREKIQIIHLLDIYGNEAKYNIEIVRERADEFSSNGLGVADSIHLAFAEHSSDYLITCDDKFIKRARRFKTKIEIINPVEFCIEEDLK